MGEGSLHPHPKGWGIRDPPRSLCIKANSLLRFDANKYLIRSHLEVESDNAGEVLYLSA